MTDLREEFLRWLLIDGDRNAVAVVLMGVAFLVLVVLGSVGVIGVENHDAVRGVVGGFVPGLIAFLSIVLSINQLVLSQEFGSTGEARRRIEAVRDYRHDVEEMAGTEPSPVLPTQFLTFVVRTIEAEAAALEESLGPDVDPEVRDEIREYARSVAEEARTARESLERVRPGRINALLPVLEYDDSRQLFRARRLRNDAGDLPAETRGALSDLLEALELFSVARTQFRTTYTQRVLARLSRQLLYVGLPALVLVVVLGLTRPEPFLSGAVRLVIVSALISVAFAPLAVLSAYLLRVAAVSERTIAVGPFASRPKVVEADRRSESGARPTDRVDPSADAARGGEDPE